jgi:hypothetical protein
MKQLQEDHRVITALQHDIITQQQRLQCRQQEQILQLHTALLENEKRE